MAAYMWNGLQPVTSFTLIPNPVPQVAEARKSAKSALNAGKTVTGFAQQMTQELFHIM